MLDSTNVERIAALKPDFLGLIFAKSSPRYVGDSLSIDFVKSIKTECGWVGVFRDEPIASLIDIVARFELSYIQLHGSESPDYCREILKHSPNIKIIKAFGIDDAIPDTSYFNGLLFAVLFDTKSPSGGGTGKQFDWNLVYQYTSPTPFLLSGGIRPDDGPRLIEISKNHNSMLGVDLNSCFETTAGIKSPEIVSKFITSIRGARQ
ncbi:MAG: phosphoribosylanthranilate isomerase [Bdellovibrionales bacterium]|nr:phosphoribosylanthranilate isomerase [Bdellovibrionales bacterium]